MQEGFIGLLKGHRSYPGRGSYKAWCVSCVKSAMSDYRGYDVGRVAIEDLLEHHLIDGNTEQEIFSGLGFEGLLRRVRNKKGREYLRLYYNHGYTFREIGERFGVSKQAVNGVARKEIKAIKRKTILTIR
jgi:RNA polymerase sigma factor (sigma-70 family)